MAICLLVVVLNLTGCGKQSKVTSTPAITPTEAPTVIQTPVSYPTLYFPTFPLGMHANPNKSTYLPGEAVEIEFLFKNEVELPIQIHPFPPTIEIRESISYHVVRSFAAGTDVKSLDPAAVVSFTVTWDQMNKAGQQVETGHYNIAIKGFYIQDTEGKSYESGGVTLGMFTIQ